MTDLITDVQESNLDDYENEKKPKKIEPTLEQSSPLHSLQVTSFISFNELFRFMYQV